MRKASNEEMVRRREATTRPQLILHFNCKVQQRYQHFRSHRWLWLVEKQHSKWVCVCDFCRSCVLSLLIVMDIILSHLNYSFVQMTLFFWLNTQNTIRKFSMLFVLCSRHISDVVVIVIVGERCDQCCWCVRHTILPFHFSWLFCAVLCLHLFFTRRFSFSVSNFCLFHFHSVQIVFLQFGQSR